MDKKSYILSKGASVSYVDEVLDGVTLIQGANCVIDAITPSADGQYTIVTFGWTGTTTGQHYTSDMRVDNGRGIKYLDIIKVDDKFHLQVTYTDDITEDVGEIPFPTVEVGTTETVEYDEWAEVTQEDTETGIKLNFKIPRGEPGSSDPIWHNV